MAIESPSTGGKMAAMAAAAKRALRPVRLFKVVVWSIIIYAILSIPYWLLVASDLYVSDATVIIQRTDQINTPSVSLPAALGVSGGPNASDQLLLREYLLSVDMLEKLDAALDLRSHYSSGGWDPISRMWFKNAPIEWFYKYWLSRVDVEYDTYSGVLHIDVQAYDPKMAQAIVKFMVRDGDAYMNQMGHDLAQSQVEFLQKQVGLAHDRVLEASQTLIDFQNKKGLVAPQTTAEGLIALIDNLETQKTEVLTQLASLPSSLSADQPTVVMLKKRLAALEQQISQRRGELASPHRQTLNYAVEEFQRLQLQVDFTQDLYKTALSALEKGRMDAARTLKMVATLQAPTMPNYPLDPKRFYNTLVTLLVAAAVIGVLKLLESIIRDHVD